MGIRDWFWKPRKCTSARPLAASARPLSIGPDPQNTRWSRPLRPLRNASSSTSGAFFSSSLPTNTAARSSSAIPSERRQSRASASGSPPGSANRSLSTACGRPRQLALGEPVGPEVVAVVPAHVEGVVDVAVHPAQRQPPSERPRPPREPALLVQERRVAAEQDGDAAAEGAQRLEVPLVTPPDDQHRVGAPGLDGRYEPGRVDASEVVRARVGGDVLDERVGVAVEQRHVPLERLAEAPVESRRARRARPPVEHVGLDLAALGELAEQRRVVLHRVRRDDGETGRAHQRGWRQAPPMPTSGFGSESDRDGTELRSKQAQCSWARRSARAGARPTGSSAPGPGRSGPPADGWAR